MDEVLMVNLDKDELFGINDFNLLQVCHGFLLMTDFVL